MFSINKWYSHLNKKNVNYFYWKHQNILFKSLGLERFAKQPSAALSVTRRKFRHMTRGALAAFWKVEMFLSRCGAGAPGKNERVAPRPCRFHYERAYRASTFEITNLSVQKTRYVSGPLLCCCVPLCSLTHRTLRREQRALSLSLPQSLRFAGFFR